MFSSRLKNLNPYVPGEQPKDKDYIKLNANENPYPPAPGVIEKVCAFVRQHPEKLGLYPDPDSNILHKEIADMINRTGGVLCRAENAGTADNPVCKASDSDRIPFSVTPDMVYTGNGSDEVLSFVFYAFFDSSEKLVCPEYSYSFYPVYCGFYDIPRDSVPLNADWSIDMEEMIARANKNHSATIIANPNAPTALALTRDQIRYMIQRCPKDRAFVVDEAYVDFGGESAIPLLSEFDNLVVVRTFSKSLCGAGMRSGFIIANPPLVNAVTTVKNSLNHFPMDAVTQIAAAAACQNDWYYADCAKKIVAERNSFSAFLRELGWEVTESKTNFIFTHKNGVNGKAVYESLKKDGILVRRFDTAGIEEYLRITIGTKEQMNKLKESFAKAVGAVK